MHRAFGEGGKKAVLPLRGVRSITQSSGVSVPPPPPVCAIKVLQLKEAIMRDDQRPYLGVWGYVKSSDENNR